MAVSYSTLNDIKTMSNYGFYMIGNTTDPVYTQGWISNKPNISVQGTTVFIDYSHTYDTSDLSFLNKIFGSTGITCTFSNTEYYDDVKNKRSYVGGSVLVNQTLNSKKIIIGKIVSGFTASGDYNYYSKENFVSVPQISSSSPGSYTGYFLVNSLPEMSLSSFKTLGILGNLFGYEEYIELSGASAENQGRLLVQNTCTLKDNQEVLYLVSGGTAQDFRTTKTTMTVFMRGDTDTLTSPRLSNLNGIFVTRRKSDNVLVNCSEYQSENQAILRKEYLSFNDVDSYGTFINCKSCPDLIYGSDAFVTFEQVGDAFNTLIFLKIINGTTVSAVTSLTGTFVTQTQTINVPQTSTDNIIKIDLSHPSLLKFDLTIYTEPTRKVLIPTNQFIKYGAIGYNNSYAILKNYTKNSTLYCTLTGTSTIYFSINV